jgi:hypothetical protein
MSIPDFSLNDLVSDATDVNDVICRNAFGG